MSAMNVAASIYALLAMQELARACSLNDDASQADTAFFITRHQEAPMMHSKYKHLDSDYILKSSSKYSRVCMTLLYIDRLC